MPLYPQVPVAPGVPAVARNASNSNIPPVARMTSNGRGVVSGGGTQVEIWGLYQNGQPLIDMADCVVSFEYKQDFDIASFPIESGGFTTYDKVEQPFDVRLQYANSGTISDNLAFLQRILDLSKTTELYDVATPELVFLNVSISHVDWRRTADHGVNMIRVNVYCVQIQAGTSDFQNTTMPSGAAQTYTGASSTTDVVPPGQPGATNSASSSWLNDAVTAASNFFSSIKASGSTIVSQIWNHFFGGSQ